jgi:hypothetical protein
VTALTLRPAARHDIAAMALIALPHRAQLGALLAPGDLDRMLCDPAHHRLFVACADASSVLGFTILRRTAQPEPRLWSAFTAATPDAPAAARKALRLQQIETARALGFDRLWGAVLKTNPEALDRRCRAGWQVIGETEAATLLCLDCQPGAATTADAPAATDASAP